jgi:hypothetical protein
VTNCFGQRFSARDYDQQVAEVQIHAAILNGFTALGIPSIRGHRLSPSGVRGSTTSAKFLLQSPYILCYIFNKHLNCLFDAYWVNLLPSTLHILDVIIYFLSLTIAFDFVFSA